MVALVRIYVLRIDFVYSGGFVLFRAVSCGFVLITCNVTNEFDQPTVSQIQQDGNKKFITTADQYCLLVACCKQPQSSDFISEGAFGATQEDYVAAKDCVPTLKGEDYDDFEENADEPTENTVASDSGKRQGKTASKACREKARRERLNECYVELAKLVDSSRSPKTDKMSILCDAIKMVKALKVENNQLKQLNKFLEEKVSSQQRDRGQDLYQNYMNLLQSAATNVQNKSQQIAQGSVDVGQSSSAAPLQAQLATQQQQQQLQQQQQQLQQLANNPQASMQQQQVPQQMLLFQQIMAAQGLQAQLACQAGPSQAGPLGNLLLQGQGALQAPNQSLLAMMQFGQQQPFFVDPQQDMKLRPPAA